MKNPKISLKQVITIVLISTILTFSITYYAMVQVPSSTFTLNPGIYPGAPSFTVWNEGSYYFAKDANGEIKFGGTNASQIITNAINAMSPYQSIVINGNVTITNTITITKPISYYQYGKATISATYLQVGSPTKPIVRGAYIFVQEIDGQDRTPERCGIKLVNVEASEIHWGSIVNCDSAILFDSTGCPTGPIESGGGEAGENRLFGGVMRFNNVGIDSSDSTVWMEGNVIFASIFSSYVTGIRLRGRAGCTMFIGVSDNVLANGTDLIDLTYDNFFLFYYVRYDYISHNPTSIYLVSSYRNITGGVDVKGWSEFSSPLAIRNFFSIKQGGIQVNITQSATSQVITMPMYEPNGLYGVLVTPSWSTLAWVTDRGHTTFTVHFSSPAPSGATIDYFCYR